MLRRGDKRAEAINNARARARAKTRAVARTKASGAMAESNEGEVAEAPKYDSAEVRDETLTKANDIEAAETTEDAGTESKEDACSIFMTSKNSARSNSRRTPLRLPLFSIQSKLSPPRRAIIRDGRWRTAFLSLQNCSALSRSIA